MIETQIISANASERSEVNGIVKLEVTLGGTNSIKQNAEILRHMTCGADIKLVRIRPRPFQGLKTVGLNSQSFCRSSSYRNSC